MGWALNNCSRRKPKGGHEAKYRGEDWELKRYLALQRDEFTCQFCKATNIRLEVHHMFMYRASRDNSLENLVSLCNICHGKVEKFGFIKIPQKLDKICRKHEVCKYANRNIREKIAGEKPRSKMRDLPQGSRVG